MRLEKLPTRSRLFRRLVPASSPISTSSSNWKQRQTGGRVSPASDQAEGHEQAAPPSGSFLEQGKLRGAWGPHPKGKHCQGTDVFRDLNSVSKLAHGYPAASPEPQTWQVPPAVLTTSAHNSPCTDLDLPLGHSCDKAGEEWRLLHVHPTSE